MKKVQFELMQPQEIIDAKKSWNSMKSFYLPEEIFALGVRIYLEKLVVQGYRLIVMVNGHGATNQIQTLERLAKEFSNERKVTVLTAFVAMPDENGVIDYGHASAAETSKVMAIHPEAVNLSRLPVKEKPLKYRYWAVVDSDAFLGRPNADFEVQDDPRLMANPQRGEELLNHAVKQIVEKVRHEIESWTEDKEKVK
ncbi:MAG: creatininase family protein [Candidatus Atribacteria bacterium]|nr:creatininase family protein [Candidatus Atribacteria bacterium]